MNAWQEYKQKLGTTRPWDILNPNAPKSSEEEAEQRLNICISCERLVQLTKQCLECGCIMAVKVKLKNATCPLNKW